MPDVDGPYASLDLTHVLYDDSSLFSLGMALVTLSPILLMAAYAALAVQTREFIVIVMWMGQFLCEGFNWALKHALKQDRPFESVGNGYGFPSSHSQYMGYFSSFLICHLYFRHQFTSTGYPILDRLWRLTVYSGLLVWSGTVAYSRYHLKYHNPTQVLCGYAIGVFLGVLLYTVSELLPARRPTSIFGQTRTFLAGNPLSTWLRIRDGWAIWDDGGREAEWIRWRDTWERKQMKLKAGH